MPITLDDIRRERERRQVQSQRQLADPAGAALQQGASPSPGITLADIQAERARRSASADPFAPIGGTGSPTDEFRTNPRDEAVQEAFPTTLAGGDNAGATIGEVIGGGLGTLTGPAAPVAVPALASVGAGIGLAVSRFVQGEPVTMQEITGEALTSAIPEVATQVGKGLLRASKAARQARFSDLTQQVRQQTSQVFNPPEAELVKNLFQQVDQSGVKVGTDAIQKHLGGLGPRYNDLLQEVRRLDRSIKSGGEFETLVEGLQAGRRGAYDIGRLQTLRSELRKRGQTTNLPFEARELIGDFQAATDDAIYRGLAKGQHAAEADSVRDSLRTARAGYARLRRTEELQGIVEGAITSDKSGVGLTISLGRIKDTIRKGTGKAGKSIQRGFEHDPVSRQQFYKFLDDLGPKHDAINVTLADLPPHTLGDVAAKIGDYMATIYTSTAGREAFKDLVSSGNGRFTHSTIANLANVARRELDRAGEEPGPRASSFTIPNSPP